MDRLSDENGFISALAFDQRGALRKLMTANNLEPTEDAMKLLKKLVAEELTPYASGILLDPEYGLDAARARDPRCGLLLAYEKTGYDTNSTKRLPDGTLVSPPLEDLAPFLPREELEKQMFIPLIEE